MKKSLNDIFVGLALLAMVTSILPPAVARAEDSAWNLNCYYDECHWTTTNFDIVYNPFEFAIDKTQTISSEDNLYDVIYMAGLSLETALGKYKSIGYLEPNKWYYGRYPVIFSATDIPSNVYGLVQPSTTNTHYSYMQLNPVPLTSWGEFKYIKVTTAHELFHSIQGRYLSGSASVDVLSNDYYGWLAESTAMWAEDIVWDDINDYVTYLQSYLADPKGTLFIPDDGKDGDVFSNHSQYEDVLFIKYLSDRYGDDTIRQIWLNLQQSPGQSIESIRKVLASHDIDLKKTFTEFTTWNYFINQYGSNENGYSESSSYHNSVQQGVKITRSHNMTQSASGSVSGSEAPQMFGANYLTFDIPSTAKGNFSFTINGTDSGDLDLYTFKIMKQGGNVTEKALNSLNAKNDATINLGSIDLVSRVVVVPIQFVDSQPSSTIYTGLSYSYSASIGTGASDSQSAEPPGFQSFPTPFKYQWVSQNGAKEGGNYVIHAKPGDTIQMSLTVKNKSTDSKALVMYGKSALLKEAPPYQGAHEIRLGTDKPRDNIPDWLDVSSFLDNPGGDRNRFTVYDGPAVGSGQDMIFTWTVKIVANATPGPRDLFLSMVREWDNWAQQVDNKGKSITPNIFWKFIID